MDPSARSPASLAALFERGVAFPPGPAHRFAGYAVFGVRFASGDVLALRRFPADSLGSGFTSVWHRRDGQWNLFADARATPEHNRLFTSDTVDTVVAPIRIVWTGSRNLVVEVDGGVLLHWRLALRSSAATSILNAAIRWLPTEHWIHSRAPRLLGALAGLLLGAGRLPLTGRLREDVRFCITPTAVWEVEASRALVRGRDLGPLASASTEAGDGGIWTPRRPLFAAGGLIVYPAELADSVGRARSS